MPGCFGLAAGRGFPPPPLQHIHSSRVSVPLSAFPPPGRVPSFPSVGQPRAAVPQVVPAPGTCWALGGEQTGKSHVNQLVLMHEIIEQSCTRLLGIHMQNNWALMRELLGCSCMH